MADLAWIYPPEPKLATEIWEWPMAIYVGPAHRQAAYVICETPYSKERELTANHLPLRVVILCYKSSLGTPRRMLAAERVLRLRDAIQMTETFLSQHPEWQPLLV